MFTRSLNTSLNALRGLPNPRLRPGFGNPGRAKHLLNVRDIACAGLVLITALALTGCFGNFPFTAEESGSQTVDAPASPRVIVETFNGEIRVSAGAEGKVAANWVKRGSGLSQADAEADLQNVEVTLKAEGDTLRVVARRTDNRTAHNSGARFDVNVPAGSTLELRTSNGEVTVRGVTGDVLIDTSNGQIRLDGGQGRLDLSTSNGAIDITAQEALVNADSSNGSLRFEGSLVEGSHNFSTSNGAIVVTLPAGARFRVSANTSNGEVTSDFPVTVSGSLRKGELNGAVGENPGISLSLRSSNGNIEIRQRK